MITCDSNTQSTQQSPAAHSSTQKHTEAHRSALQRTQQCPATRQGTAVRCSTCPDHVFLPSGETSHWPRRIAAIRSNRQLIAAQIIANAGTPSSRAAQFREKRKGATLPTTDQPDVRHWVDINMLRLEMCMFSYVLFSVSLQASPLLVVWGRTVGHGQGRGAGLGNGQWQQSSTYPCGHHQTPLVNIHLHLHLWSSPSACGQHVINVHLHLWSSPLSACAHHRL